jgi:hypothetical protein
MSIRPRLGVEVPELTAQVAWASNPSGTTAMWVRDRLDGLWDDEDFAGWYPRDGRPGISPAQLATVSVLQFLLDLSDRDAAEAVRCRTGFKYALGLELDDPGFCHSVLSDFRDRLLEEDGRAGQLLDLALARLKEAGLVRERTVQRTDSTHVQVLDGLVGEGWGRRYGRQVRRGKNPTRPKTRMNEAGADARRLLEHLAASDPVLLRGPQAGALRQVLVQNYYWDPAGRLRWRDDDGDAPNVITDVAVMPATSDDTSALHRLRPPGSRLPAGPGQQGMARPYPTSSPDAAPLIVARFTKKQCQPCPARAACTTSGDGKRTVGFPPRELYDLQLRNRADQQDPAWHKRYAVRSGIEGTVNELAHGHGLRHCRYRGQPKAHLQHVLTAIAVNIERLSQLPPGETTDPRPPTAFQKYLDQHDIQRLRSWRAVS